MISAHEIDSKFANTNINVHVPNNNATIIMSNSVINSAASVVMIGKSAIIASTPPPPAIANKMGSRRIFSPQFKIQVLESYRNDGDCKGNQRATARKYGIHRRQIQKWLQCETTLRTSVLNINNSGSRTVVDSNNNRKPTTSSSSLSTSFPKENGLVMPALQSSSSSQLSSSNAAALTTTTIKGTLLSLEKQPTRHSVASNYTTTSHQHTYTVNGGVSGSPHTSPNSLEFFSTASSASAALPSSSTASLIINVSTSNNNNNHSSQSKIYNNNTGINENKIDLMNGRKPEFVDHHHHHHAIHNGHRSPVTPATVASSSSHAGFLSNRPGFNPIYHPTQILTYPYDYPSYRQPALPIDLSVGNGDRRQEAIDLVVKDEPNDDARVPLNSQSPQQTQIRPIFADISIPSPMDLSCRKRKHEEDIKQANNDQKPFKLFKPYLLDEKEEKEEENASKKKKSDDEDTFLEVDVVRMGPLKQEYPLIWSHHHHHPIPHHQLCSSPVYDRFYYSTENVPFYPSPVRFDSATSSPASSLASPISSSAPSLYDGVAGTELNHSWTSSTSPEVISSPLSSFSPGYERNTDLYSLDLKFHPIEHHPMTHHHQHAEDKWLHSAQDLRQRFGFAF